MAKLREADQLPSEVLQTKERIYTDSAKYPSGQCRNCKSRQFQKHAKRRRWFVLVVESIVYPFGSILYRWRCAGCGKTFTNYPSLCVPWKRYLRIEIQGRAERYIEQARTTYRRVVRNGAAAVAYDEELLGPEASDEQKELEAIRHLAPSTLHRWISSIAGCAQQFQPVLQEARHLDPQVRLSGFVIPFWKYRTEARKKVLETCGRLLRALKIVRAKRPTDFATLGSSP